MGALAPGCDRLFSRKRHAGAGCCRGRCSRSQPASSGARFPPAAGSCCSRRPCGHRRLSTTTTWRAGSGSARRNASRGRDRNSSPWPSWSASTRLSRRVLFFEFGRSGESCIPKAVYAFWAAFGLGETGGTVGLQAGGKAARCSWRAASTQPPRAGGLKTLPRRAGSPLHSWSVGRVRVTASRWTRATGSSGLAILRRIDRTAQRLDALRGDGDCLPGILSASEILSGAGRQAGTHGGGFDCQCQHRSNISDLNRPRRRHFSTNFPCCQGRKISARSLCTFRPLATLRSAKRVRR